MIGKVNSGGKSYEKKKEVTPNLIDSSSSNPSKNSVPSNHLWFSASPGQKHSG